MHELIRKKSDSSPKKAVSEQAKVNKTGIPDNMKNGIEALSGFHMDDVRVHYNSDRPAQFQALAYTQGTDIHIAPGQEKHLPHEAWHVVQQMQGRVRPTSRINGIGLNDDTALEHEADVMGREIGRTIQKMKIPYTANMTKIRMDEAYENTGVQGNMIIPQYVGKPGTFHHVFPKSELVRPLRRVEQVYKYYENKSRNGAKEPDVNRLRELRNTLIVGNSAHGYYWNPGTGFAGVAPELRIDDPGNAPEPVKPRGMGDYFFTARDERPAKLNALADSIEDNELEASKIGACISVERVLAGHKVYETSFEKDWSVKVGWEHGENARIYSLSNSNSEESAGENARKKAQKKR